MSEAYEDKFGRRHVPRGDKEAVMERTIAEKLDYPHLIMLQIRNCQMAGMYGQSAFNLSVQILVSMVPDKEYDDAFREDMKKARNVELHKTGMWTEVGGLRREIIKQIESFNWAMVFNACINLFRRRGLLWSESKQEVFW